MLAIDGCQLNMIHALKKDGWRVHIQNAHFYDNGYSTEIDIGAE